MLRWENPFAEAGCMQKRAAGTGSPAVSGKSEDWDALPECFHGGGAATVREGIEGDVYAVVGLEKGEVFGRPFAEQLII